MVEVDFDLLKEEGSVIKKLSFDNLDEALREYRDMHEALSLAEDVLYGNGGESFTFHLHITSTKPYVITTQIDLI